MRHLLVFLLITVVSSDIDMATKFKIFNPASADSKTGEIYCNGRTSVVTQTTRSLKDGNCWDFINFPSSMCIQVSEITRRNFSVIELQGWDSVQLFESDDCSGEVRLLTKGATKCDRQIRSPESQKTNYWKCKVPPFRSVAGILFVPENLSLNDEIEKCTPTEEKVTLLSIDNSKGADPIQTSFTHRARFVHVQNNTHFVPNTQKRTGIDYPNGPEAGYGEGVAIYKSLSFKQAIRLANRFILTLSELSSSQNDWKSMDIFVIWQDRTRTGKIEIPVGIKTVIVQIVGACGNFKVYTNHFVRHDFYADGTKFVGNVRFT